MECMTLILEELDRAYKGNRKRSSFHRVGSLKVETDNDLCGWGEPLLEGRAGTVAAAVEELSEYLIGKDPLPVEDHWSVMYRGGFYRGGEST